MTRSEKPHQTVRLFTVAVRIVVRPVSCRHGLDLGRDPAEDDFLQVNLPAGVIDVDTDEVAVCVIIQRDPLRNLPVGCCFYCCYCIPVSSSSCENCSGMEAMGTWDDGNSK